MCWDDEWWSENHHEVLHVSYELIKEKKWNIQKTETRKEKKTPKDRANTKRSCKSELYKKL